MKPIALALAATLLGGLAASRSSRSGNPVRGQHQLPQAAAGHERRRGLGRRRQLEGRRRHLHALEQRRRSGLRRHGVAGAAVRQDRQVRARSRQRTLRVVVRARHPLRQGRQPLGDRQGLGHDRPHQSGRPRDDGVRPQEGSIGRSRAVDARHAAAAAGATASSASRPTSRGTPTATSTSATATSTRASRSSPRTATGSRRSASRGAPSSAS